MTHSCGCLLFLPASGGFADLRGRAAELDPGLLSYGWSVTGCRRPSFNTSTRGTRSAQSRVRHLVEHGRLALQVARFGVELNRQLDELDRSRARIAEAADEERRRIQRDLHDGAQQRLLTVGIGLRGDRGRLRTTGAHEDADRVDGLVADLAATIEELRRLTLSAAPAPARLGGRRGVPGACWTRAYPGHRGRRS